MSDFVPFEEYDKTDWDNVASSPKQAISAALELLHRLVIAVEALGIGDTE